MFLRYRILHKLYYTENCLLNTEQGFTKEKVDAANPSNEDLGSPLISPH
jgi:hypothetical protein